MFRTGSRLVVSLAILGCGGGGDGPELSPVEGTVKLDGQPLPEATVVFTPVAGGRPSSGVTDTGGEYELMHTPDKEGALPGKHRVTIRTATTTTDAQGNDVEVPEKLPARYNARTELEKEVTEGSNEIDFELDSEGEIYQEGSEELRPQRRQSCCCCS